MKFTNAEMGQYIDIMSGMHETGKLGYAIARNIRKMSDAAKEYIDLRNSLFKKYGKLVGDVYRITEADDPEGYKAYMEAMGDIPDIESDVDVFTVDEDTFCSGHMTSNQMAALLWMVRED